MFHVDLQGYWLNRIYMFHVDLEGYWLHKRSMFHVDLRVVGYTGDLCFM